MVGIKGWLVDGGWWMGRWIAECVFYLKREEYYFDYDSDDDHSERGKRVREKGREGIEFFVSTLLHIHTWEGACVSIILHHRPLIDFRHLNLIQNAASLQLYILCYLL